MTEVSSLGEKADIAISTLHEKGDDGYLLELLPLLNRIEKTEMMDTQ